MRCLSLWMMMDGVTGTHTQKKRETDEMTDEMIERDNLVMDQAQEIDNLRKELERIKTEEKAILERTVQLWGARGEEGSFTHGQRAAARKLAEGAGIDIRYYNIIYDAVDEVGRQAAVHDLPVLEDLRGKPPFTRVPEAHTMPLSRSTFVTMKWRASTALAASSVRVRLNHHLVLRLGAYAARLRPGRGGEHARGRGLAGTVRAEEANYLAAAHHHAHVLDHPPGLEGNQASGWYCPSGKNQEARAPGPFPVSSAV